LRVLGVLGPRSRRRQYPDAWDKERPDAATFGAVLKRAEKVIIWGGNFFADLLPRATHWLVWDKLNTMPSFGDCELAWTNIDRKSVKKLTVEWNGLLGKEEIRDHPTQKPVELMSLCLSKYALEAKAAIDPFMGSGTSLVAAKKQGLRAIGIEIEERYCEIAARRLSQEVLDFGNERKEEVREVRDSVQGEIRIPE
jgi:DNA modification methylase